LIDSLDFKALRLLPYFVLAVLVVIPAISLVLCLTTPAIAHGGSEVAYRWMSELISTLYFVKYVTSIVLFLMMYGLSAPKESPAQFRMSWHFCIFFMAGELIMQVAAWAISVKFKGFLVTLICGGLTILPDLAIMMAVWYMFRGFAWMNRRMEQKEDVLFFNRIGTLWIITHSFITLFYILLFSICRYIKERYGFVKGAVPEWTNSIGMAVGGALLAATLCMIPMIVRIYQQIRKSCYDYYLYMYNGGRST